MPHTPNIIEASMPKTIIPIIPVAAALWLVLAALGAWSTVAFAVAALAAVVSGTYLLASAVTGARHR
ncbi:putative membrane protein [Rhodococcus percolatus]|nr:hypothetical protein [Rhodococcus opacus]MBA8959193.1 putative membrane protein [Rhodococcus opacus]MBP2204758.1 putative membrane protein [Rhodococcus opacus]